jgi:hypothetical protein
VQRPLSQQPFLFPCPAPLQPALDPSPHFIPLHHRSKIFSSAFPCLSYFQKSLTFVPTTYAVVQKFLHFSGKPDCPIWHTRWFGFLGWSLLSLGASRNLCTGHLLDNSPCDQILQKVPTTPDESASTVEPKGRTNLPKVGKAETSSTVVPTVPTLEGRLGGKATDKKPSDNDPNPLNSIVVVS